MNDAGGDFYIRSEVNAARVAPDTLLLVGDQGASCLADQSVVALADRCSTPDTFENHLRRLSGEARLSPEGRQALAEELEHLIQVGKLVRWKAVAAPAEVSAPLAIDKLAIVTRGRLDGLMRSTRSHQDHFRRHGREVDVLILDSSSPGGPGMPDELRRGGSERLFYAGLADRVSFAAELAAAADVDPDIVRFALDDVHECGTDTGANRNAVLLACAGSTFLMSDDDVVCAPRALIQGDERLHLSSSDDPTRVTLFPDLDRARGATATAPGGVLEAHEALLGHGLKALLGQRPADRVWTEKASPALIRAALRGRPRVAVTASGMVGDCGASHPAYYLWKPSVREQVAGLPAAEYATLIESRQLTRACPAATVTSGVFFMTTHAAFDARTVLPPFFPTLRGQDLLFGRILRTCDSDALIGHPSILIEHLPVSARRASLAALWPQADGRFSVAALLDAAVRQIAGALGSAAGGAPRLSLLGRHLRELGGLEERDLAEILRNQLLKQAEQRLSSGYERLVQHSGRSPWAEDLQRYLRHQVENMSRLDPLVPSELVGRRDPSQAADLFRLLLRQYGTLLECWPALFHAALALQARGRGLFARA